MTEVKEETMTEKKCDKCNTLLWKEKEMYGDRQVFFEKGNIDIISMKVDSNPDDVTLETIVQCHTCEEEYYLNLSAWTPYGPLSTDF